MTFMRNTSAKFLAHVNYLGVTGLKLGGYYIPSPYMVSAGFFAEDIFLLATPNLYSEVNIEIAKQQHHTC